MNEIAPGWYKDPAEQSTQRYWDGEGWLGDALPIDATPPGGPPPSAPARAVTLPPPATPQPPAAPPGAAPAPGVTTPAGAIPPASAPPPGPPPPPGPTFPPGAVFPPGAAGRPSGAVPPGPPPMAPPGAPPGTIPWPVGVPVPPGYRIAQPFVAAIPRPHGLPIAPLGRRLVARLIDIAIVLALNAVATGWLVYLFLRDYLPLARAVASGSPLPPTPDRLALLLWVIPIVAMVVWLAYEVPALAGSGQTVGKRTVGIKVMALESTKPLGFGRALRRWGLLGWPMFMWTCGLGFILQFIDSLSPTWGGPLQLALHDRSAQTVVVHCGRRGHEITPVNVPGKPGELS